MVDLSHYITDISEQIFAQGGMSDVYLGTLHRSSFPNPGTTQGEPVPERVVIKFLRGVPNNEKDREAIKRRINRESFVWGNLEHPNVLQFYGVCRRDKGYNIYGLVAPYCTGHIMTYLLRQPRADRLELVLGIARGLHYLHAHQVVHGDMKPRNVLITQEGIPVISDFGTSRIVGYKGFTTTATSCSCRYAPPEVLLWEPSQDTTDKPTADVSPTVLRSSCDVYSFGMSMLEIVSGREPFPSKRNEAKIVLAVIEGVRPEPYQHPETPEVLWRVAAQCWDVKPENRPDMDMIIQNLKNVQVQWGRPVAPSRSSR